MPRHGQEWLGPNSEVGRQVEQQSQRCLEAYRANPLLVKEHANIERATAQGGYGHRQIYELVQNAADALRQTLGGKIYVLLTREALYCANEGAPIDPEGVDAILCSHISPKRGFEIGRFGLGFKSALGITRKPEFYSRSGSFGFNEEYARRRIREVVPDADRIPVLRLAIPVTPKAAASKDPVLRDLMGWADTVVKLPCESQETDWLSKDIANFPAEFILFSPHIGQLVLEDITSSNVRDLRLETKNGEIKLLADDKKSRWKLFRATYTPSESAKRDAGELADRGDLPIIWAVPLEGKTAIGQFWAFFPTEYKTTLRGIVNAPWKTNEDRQNLLHSEFNREILEKVAGLVVDNIANLANSDDPGAIVDILPARRDEARNWADEFLNDSVYDKAAGRRCVPNQTGQLSIPSELHLHSSELSREILEVWAACANRPDNWCHPSLETRTRRLRVERLVLSEDGSAATVREWLEALVEAKSVESSADALGVAAAVHETKDYAKRNEILQARILLTSRDELVAPDPNKIFIASDYKALGTDLGYVHQDLSANTSARKALAVLGIHPINVSGELKTLLEKGYSSFDDQDWERFWFLVELAGDKALATLNSFGQTHNIHVMTLSESFRSLPRTLLPGPVVPEDGSRDTGITIDMKFHGRTGGLLEKLGAVDQPKANKGSSCEKWFPEYREEARQQYFRMLDPNVVRPSRAYMNFDPHNCVGPLEPLYSLSDIGCSVFTQLLVEHADPRWTLRHDTRDKYPTFPVDPPSFWLAKRVGKLETSHGIRPVANCVGPDLAVWAAVLPVARCSQEAAQRLSLPQDFSSLSEHHWENAFTTVGYLADDTLIGRFYAEAAKLLPDPPDAIRCRAGNEHKTLPPSEVGAVASEHEFRVLIAQGVPVLLLPTPPDVDLVCERWKLRHAKEIVTTEVAFVSSFPLCPLIDRFPALRSALTHEQREFQYVACSDMKVETLTDRGKLSEENTFFVKDKTIYASDSLSDEQLLDLLCQRLKVTLSNEHRQVILRQKANEELRRAIRRIRSAPNHAARLLAAVGVEGIRRKLSTSLLETVEAEKGELTDLQLAELGLIVYGVETLSSFKDELEANGLEPPTHWAGKPAARSFVKKLGFPLEYAGFEETRRDSLLDVPGPPDLPPLHDFQKIITGQARKVLTGSSNRRGLLSLPTGAGKTRIAVQALTEALKDEELGSPVLWVAPTDELCEQAVQAWSEIWRGLGPRDSLFISRLWAQNSAEPVSSRFHVVVATIAKLKTIIGKPEYDWLAKASCLVIDEAHGATTPEYTALLDWQGLGRGKDRCPLIGLTATPFRGISEEETQRLVNRFGKNRLDEGVFKGDPYKELQVLGVLSRVNHRVIEGIEIRLNDQELDQLKTTHRFPTSAEQRLGRNTSRNRILLDSIRRMPEGWPVLLFATSVVHAHTMAALLSFEGITAAAISATTSAPARRHYVEEFRKGRIRVLTNYGVLTQGFDAPAVRAVCVARPTFSPNLYQQMIGRGLRGRLNGGKEECLIVNVKDNVLLFGEELAFKHFEHLWKPHTD